MAHGTITRIRPRASGPKCDNRGMSIEQHHDHPDRVALRREAIAALAQRDGSAARVEQARLAREIAHSQQAAGREDPVTIPTNFITDPARRIVTTTPAGQSLYSIADPMPDRRDDPNGDRLRDADLRRSIGDATLLSGSATQRRHGEVGEYVATERGLKPVVVRDKLGRLLVDWQAIGDGSDE